MSESTQEYSHEVSPEPGSSEIFSDGDNKVIAIQLSAEEFLANEDERMNGLIELYTSIYSQGQVPRAEDIPPEKLYATGMMSRTHCLRVGQSYDTIQFAVWAEDANFDGFRSLQNARFQDLDSYGVMLAALKKQIAEVMVHQQPAYYKIRGVLNDRYYYFTKAILPLRNEEGEIVKCFVPFTDKLPDIPPDLRQELCLADIDQE